MSLSIDKHSQTDQKKAENEELDRIAKTLESMDLKEASRNHPIFLQRLFASKLINEWVDSWDIG